ncbi:MAG: hypothetical protein AAFV53_05300 [Myxococcota bacterium]
MSDHARYRSVLTQPGLPVDDALAACDAITDRDLRGDCALSAVTAPGRDDIAGRCPAVPRGVWREECYFIAAERVNRQGDAVLAAGLCQQAGRFSLDCAQHLWQTPVHQLIFSKGTAGFAHALPAAEQLYAAWAPVLASETDFETRFWEKYFGNGFEGQGRPIDLSACDGVPAPRRDACRDAGAAYFYREIGPAADQAGEMDVLCALKAPDAAALARWLPAAPDPLLDQTAAMRVAELCASPPP